jgi:cytochrome P450
MHTPQMDYSFYETKDIEPYSFYEKLREAGDMVWDEGMQAWLITSYELAREVLKDDELFAHPYAVMKASEQYLKIRSNNPRSFHFLSGEQHRAMHRWYYRDLLSPKWVEQYKPSLVEEIIERTLKKVEKREKFDIVGDFAEWIPLGVFAKLLDLPDQTDEGLLYIKRLNSKIAAFATIANSLRLERDEPSEEDRRITDEAIGAARELDELIKPLVAQRRDGKGEDFISRLWAGGPGIFADWNELDTLDACRRLMFAGIDTTTHAIANSYYMLLTDPIVMAKVRQAQGDVRERFIEEALRLNGSVQFRPRRLSADTELAGVKLREGDMVVVFLLAANRDEGHYKCPHDVDLERDAPRDHIAFNYGSRVCLGAALARAELVEAIKGGLDRFPHLRLDPEAPPPQFKGLLHRSYKPINVRVDAPQTH